MEITQDSNVSIAQVPEDMKHETTNL